MFDKDDDEECHKGKWCLSFEMGYASEESGRVAIGCVEKALNSGASRHFAEGCEGAEGDLDAMELKAGR